MAAAAAGCLAGSAVWGRDRGVKTAIHVQRVSLMGQPLHSRAELRALPSAFYGSQDIPGSSASPVRVASVFRPVTHREEDGEDEVELPTSALAIAAAAACVSPAPFGFLPQIGDSRRHLSSPSAEFLSLCSEQLSLCEKIVGHQTNLTVYVRTAESYPTSQLEFFLAAGHPTKSGWSAGTYKEVLRLTDKSESQGSISLVESALVQHEAVELPEVATLVLPLVKDLFLVGLLVAERIIAKPLLQEKKPGRLKAVRPSWPPKAGVDDSKETSLTRLERGDDKHPMLGTFTKEQQAETAKVARTLALACVMDQRSVLLQQSSWQRGVRMDNLVEQVRGPLMAVRTLSKILLPHLKGGEISRDVVEDILVQGDRMNDVVHEIQKDLYLTNNGPNPTQYDEDILKDLKARTAIPNGDLPLDERRQLGPLPGNQNNFELNSFSQEFSGNRQGQSMHGAQPVSGRDEESPMPPLALVALPQEEMRLCNVSEVLYQLVRAGSSLAEQKQQSLQLKTSSEDMALTAAIDEVSLRQALSNLLEFSIHNTPGGGWISTKVIRAPGGGVLVVLEDNGPDIGLLVQERILGPLGSALSDSRQGNRNEERSYESGLRLIAAREVLEQSNAVLNIRSPYLLDAPIGAGGTHMEIWLPVRAGDANLQTDVQELSSKFQN